MPRRSKPELTIHLSVKDRVIVARCGDTSVEHGSITDVLTRLIYQLAAGKDEQLLALLAARARRENG